MRQASTAAALWAALAGAAVSVAVAVSADPGAAPPIDPVAPSPPPQPTGPVLPGIGVPLGVAGLGLPPGTEGLDLSTVLGQQAVPSPPGTGPGTPPGLSIFNNAYTPLPQYVEPSAPGEGVPFGVQPGQENADIGRSEWFGRWIDLYRDGRLRGGLLGQMPEAQLGQPLPGTAPPPGTNLPPGLVEYLPEPVPAQPPPG
ncbi:MAG: hypothetical protein SW019_12955 [Actinomycetota bacterium]|nr:hypothetical protein [Actinomycetota bacterium]